MASVLKVDKLDPQSGTALEIDTSGDTISVPSGATLDISASTLTPPATMPASSGINFTALNATNLGSGTVPTARLGTGTASSSTVLYGDQTYKAEPGGTNTPYFRAGMSGDITPADATWVKMTFDTEVYDSGGDFDSSTNYRFTPTTAGYYYITLSGSVYKPGTILNNGSMGIRFNGSEIAGAQFGNHGSQFSNVVLKTDMILLFNGSSDYVEGWAYVDTSTGAAGQVSSGASTYFQGFRILT